MAHWEEMKFIGMNRKTIDASKHSCEAVGMIEWKLNQSPLLISVLIKS
jgi:hypothetical protein